MKTPPEKIRYAGKVYVHAEEEPEKKKAALQAYQSTTGAVAQKMAEALEKIKAANSAVLKSPQTSVTFLTQAEIAIEELPALMEKAQEALNAVRYS